MRQSGAFALSIAQELAITSSRFFWRCSRSDTPSALLTSADLAEEAFAACTSIISGPSRRIEALKAPDARRPSSIGGGASTVKARERQQHIKPTHHAPCASPASIGVHLLEDCPPLLANLHQRCGHVTGSGLQRRGISVRFVLTGGWARRSAPRHAAARSPPVAPQSRQYARTEHQRARRPRPLSASEAFRKGTQCRGRGGHKYLPSATPHRTDPKPPLPEQR